MQNSSITPTFPPCINGSYYNNACFCSPCNAVCSCPAPTPTSTSTCSGSYFNGVCQCPCGGDCTCSADGPTGTTSTRTLALFMNAGATASAMKGLLGGMVGVAAGAAAFL